jgi:hypothetical protein
MDLHENYQEKLINKYIKKQAKNRFTRTGSIVDDYKLKQRKTQLQVYYIGKECGLLICYGTPRPSS